MRPPDHHSLASSSPLATVRLCLLDVMCCREVSRLPEGPDWIYEMKWHGCRVKGMKADDSACLLTRNHFPLDSLFPEVLSAMAGLSCRQAVVDGQLLALDGRGAPCGCPLTMVRNGMRPAGLRLELFDLIELDGRYVAGLPCNLRKQRLETLLPQRGESGILSVTAALVGTPAELMEMARSAGQAGVVAKRRESTYEEGRREGEWVKCLLAPAGTLATEVLANMPGAGMAAAEFVARPAAPVRRAA